MTARGGRPPGLTPKSVGVRAVGACGHEWSRRVPLGAGLARVPLSVEVAARIDAVKAAASSDLSSGPCGECVAAEGVSGQEAALGALCRFLDVPGLPGLDGSLRQRAFAGSVRLRFVSGVLADVVVAAERRLSHPTLAERLYDVGFSRLFGSGSGVPGDEEILRLRAVDVNALRWGFLPGVRLTSVSHADRLVLWMVLRRAWLSMVESSVVGSEVRSSAWIGRARRPRPSFEMVLAGSVVGSGFLGDDAFLGAAVLVARHGAWGSRFEAFEAATVFAELGEDCVSFALGREGVSLPELAEELGVMRLLGVSGGLSVSRS